MSAGAVRGQNQGSGTERHQDSVRLSEGHTERAEQVDTRLDTLTQYACPMAEMTEEEARQLTKQLQSKTQQLAKLIKKAHDGRVWEPLGYSSFTDWSNNELPFTHGRAFQLLNIGVLTELLHETSPLSQTFVLTDKQARAISSYGREQFLKDFKAAASDDSMSNAFVIQKLITAKANDLKAAEEDEEEEEKPRKARATIKGENTTLIDGGTKNSRTLLYLGRTLRTQTSEFPKPENLSPELREQGFALLLEAKSNLEKAHDEIVDRMKKLEGGELDPRLGEDYLGDMGNVPVEAETKEEVKVND